MHMQSRKSVSSGVSLSEVGGRNSCRRDVHDLIGDFSGDLRGPLTGFIATEFHASQAIPAGALARLPESKGEL
jgi:hypothetical protein